MSLLLFAGVQSYTTVTYGWSLGKIDIVEDIGVPCLMNSERLVVRTSALLA